MAVRRAQGGGSRLDEARGSRPTSAFSAARELAFGLLAAPPTLVVSDFDGTLSPIHPDPLGARIEPLGRTALRRLARLARARPDRLRLVVLSGRAVADVASRVRVGGVEYLGNHGIETGRVPHRGRAESVRVVIDPALEPFVEQARALGERVASLLGRPDWLYVEAKAPSVAFHFRQAPDPAAALRRIDEAVATVVAAGAGEAGVPERRPGFERFDGRKVVELRPAGAGGKGAAVARIVERERPGSVLVLGDDRSDAEAFRVVRAGRDEGRYAALAVGVHGAAETPAEVAAAADLVLDSPRDAARLLSVLGRRLERQG